MMQKGPARLRVGMHTTVGPRCGIADYTRALTTALAPHAEITTVPIYPGRLNPVATLAAGMRLGRHDVAHIQHTYSFFGVDPLTYTIVVRLLLASIRAPLVLTAHTVRESGPARYNGGLGSRLANAVGAPAWHDAETFRRADAVIVHSSVHRKRLADRGLPSDRIHVVPPGIPPWVPVAAEAVAAFRSRFNLPTGRPVVGVFGFLEGSKRFPELLEAVASLPCAPILLVAGGPRRSEHETVREDLVEGAKLLGLGGRLIVTGYLEPDAVPIALEAMDLVVVPYATDDSMPYSLHRVLGQGRPVVATDLPGLREVQGRGDCLVLVPPADPVSLRETLGRLLEDAPARARLATAAVDYAARESVAVAAARTLRVYVTLREAHRCGDRALLFS
jgi:glycosyltransferase involved in cell wall biosynthesis